MANFDEFCRDWDRWCVEHKHLNSMQKGAEFEDRMAEIILPFVPDGQYLAHHAHIRFVPKEFDWLALEANKRVRTAFEVKAHGFYKRAALDEWALIVPMMKERGITFFYVCYRENNYYDERARRLFGTSYYRLSDDGKGTEDTTAEALPRGVGSPDARPRPSGVVPTVRILC